MGGEMYNRSPTALTKVKKRWRRAYLATCFANTMAKNAISKVPVSETFFHVVPKVSFGIKHMSDQYLYCGNDQTQLKKMEQKVILPFNSLDLSKISRSMFQTPTPVRLFYFAVMSFFKDERTDVSGAGMVIEEMPDHHLHTIDQGHLIEIVQKKDPSMLQVLGGVKGLAKTLSSDLEIGITDQDLSNRRTLFGSNTYERQPPKGFLYFVGQGFRNILSCILMVCAALSLVFGIKTDRWYEYEGGSILFVVFLAIILNAIVDLRVEKQFDDLSKLTSNIKINVVRQGRRQSISISDIVVGDIVVLNAGDQIPADGLFVDWNSLTVDESSLTGASELLVVNAISNPFLFSGSLVADGHGRMLVLSVGKNTAWGQTMSSTTFDYHKDTPLQSCLHKLVTAVAMVGLAIAFLLLLVLFIRYFTGNTKGENVNQHYNGKHTSGYKITDSVLTILMVAVATLVVAIPEGLPLAVTLTLAYSMKRMMSDQAMVRKLSACETMGAATVICTDKTGTLTMNQMAATKFWLGFEQMEPHSSNPISIQVVELLHEAVGFNTTGTVFKHASRSAAEYSGSPTEKAILSWAVEDLDMDIEKLKQSATVLHVETFNSKKKRSGVSIRRNDDNTVHVHWKGAAEMVLAMCSKYYNSSGSKEIIDNESRKQLGNIIEGMAASGLRCLAFAHKKVPEGTDYQTLPEEGLTLLGIVGLKNPCRPGLKEAVETCMGAGVQIKMITGDNVFTAKAIATECGILQPGQGVCEDEVMQGVRFRNLTDEERMQKVDKIRVMARSSPNDKLLLVKLLKEKGHVVAVTGDGTNDAPALKDADIGLAMGIQGTEVAKQSSDILILDDDFSTIVTTLRWGRWVYNNIQNIMQYQLTTIFAATAINFIAAVTSGDVPLTAVQLLWVTLIMHTLGSLALATERPSRELLNKPPVGRVEPLITNIMWRNLLAQAVFQITVLLAFQFKGKDMFNVDERVKNTIIFNTFVLCQVFNEFNSRKLEKRNIFKGIHKNRLFMGIIGITVVLQIVMVEFLKNFADTERLNGVQWGICVGVAALSWPIGWFVKWIPVPDKPFLSSLDYKIRLANTSCISLVLVHALV